MARVYAKAGLIAFGYNFPNKKSLQASLRKKENANIKQEYQQSKKTGQRVRPKKEKPEQ